jgi:hypothetical protein
MKPSRLAHLGFEEDTDHLDRLCRHAFTGHGMGLRLESRTPLRRMKEQDFVKLVIATAEEKGREEVRAEMRKVMGVKAG